MKKNLPFEFVYQVGSLLVATLVIHSIFTAYIRPEAEAILEIREERLATGEVFTEERSLYVVLKDYEQECCFILMLWAFSIMGYKFRNALRERGTLQTEFINVGDGMSILPEDTREYTRPIQALEDETQAQLLPRAMMAALHRFSSTRNVQDVAEAVRSICDSESDRLDTELSLVRYIAWAIPSIGFIGTVRGIGDALGQAYRAVEGDIAGVTASLGVAFNSTFVALVISIVIMFLVHQLQLIQERVVLDTQTYCDEKLIRHMQVR